MEKANLLNKRAKLASIAHYHDSSHYLDSSAKYRHRHDIARFVNLSSLGQFAMVEDHKNSIFVFNSRLGKHVATISTESAPISIETIPDKDRALVVTSGADMTLSTFALDDPNPKRRYKVNSTWATPGVQMALAYSKESDVLYSGATNGNIYSWNWRKRSLLTTLTGHTDIVMNLIVLQKLDNIASASLDKTLGIWDSHTSEQILKLTGHRKGVFDVAYNSTYRLIFSCGFEHDACVWSPFVNSMVYRLKGHHASLVGVQTVENSPEVITADTSGVFKLWDVRNFQCVQTFSANLTGQQDSKDSSKLTCFFHTKLPSTNALQKEDDSRLYAASKMLFSFDQARVVHEATTDYTNVSWVAFNSGNSVIITASDYNVIVWDALIGSKTFTHTNICGEEISACCLDDRQRKILIGDVTGKIGVYNYSSGALMKTVHQSNPSVVISLQYFNEMKRFIAGYANGVMCIYDENVLEECHLIRMFENLNRHPELICLRFHEETRTVATCGGSSDVARLWDYDSGKCDTELKLCSSSGAQIVTLMILMPHPIVVTSDSVGNIIFWGSRGIRWQGLRISGCLNQTPAYADYEPRRRYAEDEEEPPRRAIPPIDPHVHDRPLEANSRGGPGSHGGKQAKDEAEEKAENGGSAARRTRGEGSRGSSPLRERRTRSILSSSVSTQSTLTGNPSSPSGGLHQPPSRQRGLRASFTPSPDAFSSSRQTKETNEEQAIALLDQSERKWGKVAAAQSMAWDPISQCFFAGDDMGCLRAFDIQEMLQDFRVDDVHEEGLQHRILGSCRLKSRDAHSALPPRPDNVTTDDEFENGTAQYLLGKPSNAMAYLGIRFRWALFAHHDRIISCTCIGSHGVMTSAADRLVKMWTFQGEPLGTLLQSVPVGVRSRSWELVLNVDEIIRKENEELDEIIDKAQAVVSNPDKPDIATMDFTGMQLGAQSAEFSRSVLRQRIEKSARILGLDFPASQPPGDLGGEKRLSVVESVVTFADTHTSSVSGPNGIPSASMSLSSMGNKSIPDALREVKSTESAVDYDLKTKQMSYIQQKRKANKLALISKMYEAKTGVVVKTTKGTKEPSLWQDEGEEKAQVDLDNLLTRADDLKGPQDEASINRDMYSLESLSQVSPTDRVRVLPQARAKLLESIQQVHETGARTINMRKSCMKYSSFTALDQAIQHSAPRRTIIGRAGGGRSGSVGGGAFSPDRRAMSVTSQTSPRPSPAELEELRSTREKKHLELFRRATAMRLNDSGFKTLKASLSRLHIQSSWMGPTPGGQGGEEGEGGLNGGVSIATDDNSADSGGFGSAMGTAPGTPIVRQSFNRANSARTRSPIGSP